MWLHAVSVGEVLSAVTLIRRLRALRPDLDVYVSTTTLAGRETAEQRLQGLARGVFFAPLDYVSIVRRVLRRMRPSVFVVMETEIWPNLYRESKRAGAQLAIVNGRISDQAAPQYQGLRWFFRHVLACADAIWVQSPKDAERFIAAGAQRDRVQVAGNLKYDFEPPRALAEDLVAFMRRTQSSQTWVAASTMPPAVVSQSGGDPDEDDAVIAAFVESQTPRRLLVLAPRHPARFDLVANKLCAAGVRFTRRSQLREIQHDIQLPGVLLLDTIGELAAMFEYADVVFMGGTLASRGGHNILEPAYFGKPVIAGPHMENFAEMAAEFDAAGALVRIDNASELGAAMRQLADNPGSIGTRAQALAQSKRGVVERVAALVIQASDEGVPEPPRICVARWTLGPLACLWAAGNRINLARNRRVSRSISTRVVSVGGLTMGGAGKTPIVAHLAAHFDNAAILTRGYRRQVDERPLIVHRGAEASVEETGDEAQLYIRRDIAHVGIGSDRYEVARTMAPKLAPDVFLLDDGFQHVQFKRDADIVLIDAENPWGGGLFPLGYRREPLDALARATAIVLTRVPRGAKATGIERVIRRYNPTAPVFRSRMVPEPWTGPRKVGAFCGIGSPAAFWRTLDELGLDVAYREAFRDHHVYSHEEIAGLDRMARAAGAEVLVTTEKDMMNLPQDVLLAFDIRCVRIVVEIDNEAALMKLVRGGE